MKVRFTSVALRQIDEAISFLAARFPRAASGLSKRVRSVTAVVREYPEAAQATSRKAIRRAVLSPYPYVLFYRVTADEIIVLTSAARCAAAAVADKFAGISGSRQAKAVRTPE